MKSRLTLMGGGGLARLIGFVARTSEHRYDPENLVTRFRDWHPAICACWHGQFMMLSEARPEGLQFAAMVARHGDAEFIGEAMRRLDVELIRGAGAGGRKKDRGGAHALKVAVRALADGKSIVMTADVPPGPARQTGAGIVTLARLSGRPIVPLAAATSRYHALNTWSRLTINLPYSRLAFAAGEPIWVPRDATPEDLERLRLEVQASLNDATARAYELAGSDPRRSTPPGARDPNAAPLPAGGGIKTYRAATRVLQAAAPLVLKYRERHGKETASRRGERYGIGSVARPEGPLMWVHAASVGETNAILPVIEAMATVRPDLRVLLTTGTRTSARLAEERLANRAIHQFVPLDTPGYARAFLEHWRPDLAVFTESEIWPNLILETSERSVPLVLINGRISKRSYQRWRKRPGIAGPLFNRFDAVLAQNELFARWFRELGARRVEVAGNLKIDAPPLPVDNQSFDALAAAVAGRRGYVAASTHAGEEEIAGDAHRKIAAVFPGFLTIIAPRHPERGTAIAELLKTRGLKVAQRSLQELPDKDTEIYIADTIGELGTFYALTPLALIGGSLVDKGGQNPIEAIRHGGAVMAGPHQVNFADIYGALRRRRGLVEVSDTETLASAVVDLMADEPALESLRQRAGEAIEDLSGALDSTLGELLARLPPAGDDTSREFERAS